MFSKINFIHSRGTGAAAIDCLFIKTTNLTAEQKSISVSGSKLWNDMSFDIRNLQSSNAFEKKYEEFLMDQDQ